jgi:hypothetical protein
LQVAQNLAAHRHCHISLHGEADISRKEARKEAAVIVMNLAILKKFHANDCK